MCPLFYLHSVIFHIFIFNTTVSALKLKCKPNSMQLITKVLLVYTVPEWPHITDDRQSIKGQPTSWATETVFLLFVDHCWPTEPLSSWDCKVCVELLTPSSLMPSKTLQYSGLGKICTMQVHYASNPVTVFIKEYPEKKKTWWPSNFCSY